MRTHENDDWIEALRKPMAEEPVWKKASFSIRSPSTPVHLWQRAIGKARYVRAFNGGANKGAIVGHTRYLLHKNSREHEDRLIGEIGDIKKFLKSCDKVQPHYRIIIAPQRGDVLDIQKLAKNAASEVMLRFGKFEYAGAIHEKLQSNGRLNKHIHLIFKAPFDVGAAALKYAFGTAAAREATLQFEEMGLHYIPDPLDNVLKMEARQLEKELIQGDHA